MKAIVINRYGPAEVMEYEDIPKPVPKAEEVLVQVRACSVNPADWKIRSGALQLLTGYNFPLGLGSDFAGVVEAVGSKVTQFWPGDEVFGAVNPLSNGSYAEYVAIAASHLAKKPSNLSFEEAAGVPVAGVTALQSLLDLGELRPGQKVLVNGASGGVGTFAVQIAKALFADVTGVCSGKNVELVTSLGADAIIDYHQQDVTRQIAHYDIIFDTVDTLSFSQCDRILAPQGVYISTLPSPETIVQAALTAFLPGKKAKIVLAQPNHQQLQSLCRLIEEKKVKTVIDRTYPLAVAAAAHNYSETGEARGKIILTVVPTAEV